MFILLKQGFAFLEPTWGCSCVNVTHNTIDIFANISYKNHIYLGPQYCQSYFLSSASSANGCYLIFTTGYIHFLISLFLLGTQEILWFMSDKINVETIRKNFILFQKIQNPSFSFLLL